MIVAERRSSADSDPGHFVTVADASQIAEGQNRVIYFQNKEVVIFNLAGDFFAMDNLCPHQQGPLSEGELSGDVVTCPWHGARFNVRTGQGLDGPHKSNLHCYELKVEGTEIKLHLRKNRCE